MKPFDLGQVSIRPRTPVEAGSLTTITWTYTAGHPIDDTGYVKVVLRYASDCAAPQFTDPTAAHYTSIRTTGQCRIEPRWDPKGHTRPWGRALYLKVMGGFLDRGEKIVVVFGDRSHGSPGWRVQTFCETSFEFKTLVDPFASYEFKELPDSPTLRIRPGKPARAVCVAPSQVAVGKKFDYFLKLEDRWGNPLGRKAKRRSHRGFSHAGTQVITARDPKTRLSASSNPIDVVAEPPRLKRWWADFHGQSEETIGTNTIEDYFRFARDQALVDIASHQGNDFQITDAFWRKINDVTKEMYEAGAFVTFPGFEWSGNTPLGGDRNVFFTTEGGKITRSSNELLPGHRSRHPISPTAQHLFGNLRKQTRPRPFAVAHVGGRYSDLRIHDAQLELAVEVHSAWGTFEWLIDDALSRGYRVGICANSDGHKGRPGASYPGASKFGSYGGLTCVLAPQLDRRSVYAALRARHFYATTGNRSWVDVRVVAASGKTAILGDEISVGPEDVQLQVRVVGTAPIEDVEVRDGTRSLKVLRPYSRVDLGRRVKIVWSGAEVRGRDRLVAWDGGLHLQGNSIVDAVPINFWNPNQPLQRIGRQRLAWTSNTTGGAAGVILTLRDANRGTLEIDTAQRRVRAALSKVGLKPRTWNCGGLEKRIAVYRLPGKPGSREFSFSMPLRDLRRGVHPFYIRMTQEDGHQAWTSPVYVIRK